MTKRIETLTNPHITRLSPYQSARRLFSAADAKDSQLWLNANEAPTSQEYSLQSELLNRYPDCQPSELIHAYASYAQIAPKELICTRGADEGIELLIRAFCEASKDSILICPPTYGMYAISAQTFNVGVNQAPLLSDFSLDLEAIKSHSDKVKLVFLCSPNNPTGTLIPREQIIEVLSAFENKALVVVDEAYIEFSSDSTVVDLLNEFPHLVILRTLSKAFALAGIRCGFTLANADIIEVLLKVIAPYPIAAPVAQIACQALSKSGIELMRERVHTLNTELSIIRKDIELLEGCHIIGDSKANFILFRHEKNAELMQYLVSQNIFIRDQSKQLSLNNCLRITVGSASQNQTLLNAIKSFFIKAEKEPA